MSLLTQHFWKFFFTFIALIASGVFVIYIAGIFDGAERATVDAADGRAAESR